MIDVGAVRPHGMQLADALSVNSGSRDVLFLCLQGVIGGYNIALVDKLAAQAAFLPCNVMHKCGLCRHALSVCLSVCHVHTFC